MGWLWVLRDREGQVGFCSFGYLMKALMGRDRVW